MTTASLRACTALLLLNAGLGFSVAAGAAAKMHTIPATYVLSQPIGDDLEGAVIAVPEGAADVPGLSDALAQKGSR